MKTQKALQPYEVLVSWLIPDKDVLCEYFGDLTGKDPTKSHQHKLRQGDNEMQLYSEHNNIMTKQSALRSMEKMRKSEFIASLAPEEKVLHDQMETRDWSIDTRMIVVGKSCEEVEHDQRIVSSLLEKIAQYVKRSPADGN